MEMRKTRSPSTVKNGERQAGILFNLLLSQLGLGGFNSGHFHFLGYLEDVRLCTLISCHIRLNVIATFVK